MDYYGDYVGVEHKPVASAPPLRVITQQHEIDNGYFCLISTVLMMRSIITITTAMSLLSFGIRHVLLYFFIGFDVVTVISIMLMCCAVNKSQPYACIPYVVLRTMELFFWLCVVGAFGWAVFDPRSEYFNEAFQMVRTGATAIQLQSVELKDLTWQLCVLGTVFSVVAFALSLEGTRHAWRTTIQVTDDSRKKIRTNDLERRRIMVASDELYTNY